MAVAPNAPGARSGEPAAARSADAQEGEEAGLPTAALALEPGLQAARVLARGHSLIPLSHTFVDDCETPVSAFLKLRALAPGEPAFLLESAEQGQRVGRWSFIGFRPRAVLRWSLGDGGDPYALAAEHVGRFSQAPMADAPPFTGGAVGFFGYDLVRVVEPLVRSRTRSRRAARHGADDVGLAGRVRPSQAHGHDPRERGSPRRARHRARL